ncbi:MAG TPA: hypothetical protein VLI05_02515 [Candidatus Saccharimonadia bacterium]|nr:hypothetical protein [Candidatus Saccharimonadia bacterium]
MKAAPKSQSTQRPTKAQRVQAGAAAVAVGAITLAIAMLINQPHADLVLGLTAGLVLIGLIMLLAGGITFRRQPYSKLLGFAIILAFVAAAALTAVLSMSGASACPGTQDCDTSFGLGLPFIAVVLFPICLLVLTLARWLGRLAT